MSYNPENVLPGGWTYVSVVTDMGGTAESEELVGYVNDEKTISREFDEAEWAFPEARNRVRKRLHAASDFEFQVAVVADLTNLQTLDLIDTSGTSPSLKNTATVALRLDIFESKPDDHTAVSGDLVIDIPTVDVAPTEMTLPQDGGSFSVTGYINSDIEFPEITTA